MHRSVALQKIKVILNLLFRFPNGFVSGSMFHHAFFFGFTKREEEEGISETKLGAIVPTARNFEECPIPETTAIKTYIIY